MQMTGRGPDFGVNIGLKKLDVTVGQHKLAFHAALVPNYRSTTMPWHWRARLR